MSTTPVLDPVRRGPLIALLVATVTALTGRQLSSIALPWLVLTTTGSASRAGLVAAVVVLPGLVVGLLGGVLIDRLGYRRVAIAANLVSAAGTVMIPLLYVTVGLAFWQLLLFVFIGSLLEIPAITAGRSMVPELAALARQPLERVNALFESAGNVSLLVGTPVAGLLVATLGAQNVLWIDAGMSLVGAVVLLVWVPGTVFARRAVAISRGIADDLLAGLRFIRRDRLLWPMAVVLALSNAVSGAVYSVLLPFYAEGTLESATALGLTYSALGVGALAGSVLYGALAGRIPRRLVWSVAFLVVPIELWVLLVSPGVGLLIAVFVLAGFVGGPLNPLMVTIRHERSPAQLRGRVFSTYSTIAMSAQPIGLLAAGQAVDGLGFLPAVLVFSLLAQAVGIATVIVPGFRDLDRPAGSLPSGAAAVEPGPAR